MQKRTNGKIEDVVQQTTENSEKLTKHEQDINSITDTVQAVETNLNENYSTTEETTSIIKQETGTITQEVNKKIEDIQIGGTNLIRNSAPYDLYHWTANGTNVSLIDELTSPYGKCIKVLYTNTKGAGVYNYLDKSLEIGEKYSWSVWIKANKSLQIVIGQEQGGTKKVDITTQWQKITHTFIAQETIYNSFVFYMYSGQENGTEVYIHSVKLENGNKITAWSPSPNDTATKVEMNSKIEQTAESINLEVSKKAGKDEVVSTINQSAEQIDIKGNRFIVESTNFNLTKEGKMSCRDAEILGGIVKIKGGTDTNPMFQCYMESDPQTRVIIQPRKIALYIANAVAVWLSSTTGKGTIDIPNNGEINIFKENGNMGTTINANNIIVGGNNKCVVSPTGNTNISSIGFVYKSDGSPTNYGYIKFSTEDKGDVGVNVWQSDERLKKDIKDTKIKALDIIKQMIHRSFKWKRNNGIEEIGYIAQELEKIKKNFVIKIPQKDGSETYQINETKIIPYITKSIQEQQGEIEELKQKDKEKDELIANLISRVEKLEKAGESNE